MEDVTPLKEHVERSFHVLGQAVRKRVVEVRPLWAFQKQHVCRMAVHALNHGHEERCRRC